MALKPHLLARPGSDRDKVPDASTGSEVAVKQSEPEQPGPTLTAPLDDGMQEGGEEEEQENDHIMSPDDLD